MSSFWVNSFQLCGQQSQDGIPGWHYPRWLIGSVLMTEVDGVDWVLGTAFFHGEVEAQ